MLDLEVLERRVGELAGDAVGMDQPKAEKIMKTLGLWQSGHGLVFEFGEEKVTTTVASPVDLHGFFAMKTKTLADMFYLRGIKQGDRRMTPAPQYKFSKTKPAAKRSGLMKLIST